VVGIYAILRLPVTSQSHETQVAIIDDVAHRNIVKSLGPRPE
jgi:hypothetical protein